MTKAERELLMYCARRLLLLWVGNKGSKRELEEKIAAVGDENE